MSTRVTRNIGWVQLAPHSWPKEGILDTKKLLIKQTLEAFEGEMSLMGALDDLTQEEASWRFNNTTWTIEEIIYHVASCKIEYCKQGFGQSVPYDKLLDDVSALLANLDQAHELMARCLTGCTEEALDQPIPTQWHGESAAHFFWIMVMHRVSHAAQIRTLRRAYGSRTDYYPIG